MMHRPLTHSTLPEDQENLVRDVLGQVAGKWAFGVLCVLSASGQPLRFTRVLEGVEGITQKVLTQTLRCLERDGFVSRTVYAQVPPRVEYELTELGWDLAAQVDPFVEWARSRVNSFAAARRRFDGGKQSPATASAGPHRARQVKHD